MRRGDAGRRADDHPSRRRRDADKRKAGKLCAVCADNAEVRIVERLLRNGVVGIGHVAHPQLVEERRACGVGVLKGERAVIERLNASEAGDVGSAAAKAGQGDVHQ